MIWMIGTLVALIIVGLTVYQTNATTSSPDLNSEEIIELVNIQYPGRHSEPELSVENGEPVYQMEVTQDQGVYSLKLNGDTGQVIDLTAVEKKQPLIIKKTIQKNKRILLRKTQKLMIQSLTKEKRRINLINKRQKMMRC